MPSVVEVMVPAPQRPANITTEEIDALPGGVAVFHVEPLQVPGLDAERCIVWLRDSAAVASALA